MSSAKPQGGLSDEEWSLVLAMRGLPQGCQGNALRALRLALQTFAGHPHCPEMQADGVPCPDAHADCAECRRAASAWGERAPVAGGRS